MLVEREEYVHRFSGQLDSLAAGSGCTLVISGPVASGKTRLLRTFLADAADRLQKETGASSALLLAATGSPAVRALPLGLLSQLLGSVDLPPDLQREMDAGMAEPTTDGALTPEATRLAQRTAEALIALAADRPVVIAVDDVQDGDALSLECLLYLARQLMAAPIMLVVAVRSDVADTECRFHFELLREGIGSGIRLGRLSRHGVTALVADRLGRTVADRIGAACYAATRGNCLLVGGALDDHAAEVGRLAIQRDNRLFVGEAFGRAVIGCLDRGDPRARRVAEAIAVLGDSCHTRQLSEVARVDERGLARAVGRLEAIGILNRHGFSHPVAREAVLARLTSAERAEIHTRSAVYLQQNGGSIDATVDHLLAAGEVRDRSALSLLQCAAEQALIADDVDRALQCLQLAAEHCSDGRQRAAIVARLASVLWRNSPIAVAEHHLCVLLKALQEGTLPTAHAQAVLCYLLWHGRVEEAGHAVSMLFRNACGVDGPTAEEMHSLEWWLRHSYPPLADRIPARERRVATPGGVTPDSAASGRLLAAGLVSDVLAGGSSEDVVIGAQRILQSCPLGDDTLDTLATALITLINVDRLDLARPWCDELIQQAHERHAPTWAAVLGAVRADIARREGYMAATVSFARTALDVMPAHSWGTNIGLVRASLIVAHTRMDEYEEAAEQIRQPLPDGLFESRFGLHYLFARGQYYQAIERPYAALNDFNACGDLLAKWGMDLPNIVAWRSAAAHCHLALGQRERARELAEEQVRLSPQRTSRSAGLALRVLAATVPLADRIPVLDSAVEVFTRCAARFHLAGALLDLGNAHHDLGDDGKARVTIRHAQRIAKECRARRLQRGVPSQRTASSAGDVTLSHDASDAEELSDAERRVASLAGLGHTNRQIADKLYVTVSTVEQHLTRIYRKLGITRRSELATALSLQVVQAM